jgi:DNA-binding beta-propeller fold protein YncE
MTNACVLLCLLAFTVQLTSASALTLVKTVPLPGVVGRLGHLAVDAQRQLLYVAATANNTIEVVDLQASRRVRQFEVKDPRDLLVLSKPNLLFIALGSEGQVKIFDGAAGRAIKTIGSLPDAGTLRFDAPANRVYAGFGAGALAMINAQTGVRTVTIHLPAPPDAFAVEEIGGRIFVNLPPSNQVAVVDRLTREVTASWSLGTCAGNYALAFDETNGRLFVGCRQPPRLVVLNTNSGQAVTDIEIAGEVANLFYDAQRKRVYASCGDGFLEAIDQTDADHYVARPSVTTVKDAATSLFDAGSGSLFLAVPPRAGHSAELRVYRVEP